MKAILRYVGRSLMIYGLSLMFGLAMFAVAAIGSAPVRIVFSYVLLASCFVVDFYLCRIMGRTDYKARLVGALKREKSEFVSDVPGSYHPSKDYKPYKGFVVGLGACLVPIILIIVAQFGQSDGLRLALFIAGGWAVLPIVNINNTVNLFYGLIICAVMCTITGVAYISGGKKERLLQYVLGKKASSL